MRSTDTQANLALRFPWKAFGRISFIQSLVLISSLGASGLAARYFFKRQFIGQVQVQLRESLVSLSHDLHADARPDWCATHARATSFRFTLVDARGMVLCDSHSEAHNMENHAQRPEVAEARSSGFSYAIRESRTIHEEMLYAALDLRAEGLVLRGAIPLQNLNKTLHVFDRSLVLFLVGLTALMTLVSLVASRRLIRPLGRLLEASLEEISRNLAGKTQTLAIEREQLATLMSSISDAILAVDLQGKALFFNSQLALLLGLKGVNIDNFLLREAVRDPLVLDAFKSTFARETASFASAIPFDRGDDKKFVSVSISPLRDPEGRVYGAVGIFHDVTELKTAEQMRMDFVANVSHELRTPLTSIRGYAETIRQDVMDGRAIDERFIGVIVRNVDRLMNLLSDLLDLASLESGRSLLHPEHLSTGDLTNQVLQQLRPGFEGKNQMICVETQVPFVWADPKRLEQVLVNLLDNAHKYTPEHGRVWVSWEDGKPGEILLKVKDSGPGIAPEHHARLFERFYRVDKGRSRDVGGTGLGLSIVKHIIQKHGGEVWIESAPPEPGSTFVCKFKGPEAHQGL